jgi:hypothetical protein
MCELHGVQDVANACQECPQGLRALLADCVAAGCAKIVHEFYDAAQSGGPQADESYVAGVDAAAEALAGKSTAVVLQSSAEDLQVGLGAGP